MRKKISLLCLLLLFMFASITGNSVVAKADVMSTEEVLVEQKVNALVEECMASGVETEYDKVLWMHDWLIHNANYDYTYTMSSAAGVLLHGSGVCQSYSDAYKMLLDKMGIENQQVVSEQMNHVWNIVKVDGSWTHIDCTWDDPNTGGYENHSYFGLSDAEMAVDHQWENPELYPACYTIKKPISSDRLNNPYPLQTAEEGIDFYYKDIDGSIISRKDYETGNMLLVYGRPECGNTRSFIKEITPWKDILAENNIHVIVVFENETQVREHAASIPFVCVYEADFGYSMYSYLEQENLLDGYTYPLIVLQNTNGYKFYHSVGFVSEPERILSTAMLTLPKTKEIEGSALYTFTDEASIKEAIDDALEHEYSEFKLYNRDTVEVSEAEAEFIINYFFSQSEGKNFTFEYYFWYGDMLGINVKYPETQSKPMEFSDVTAEDWFYESVNYMSSHNIMTGDAGAFNPYGNMSRAMVVTTLYRLTGSPEVENYSASSDFKDMETGAWYEDAVNWAYNENVTTGYELGDKLVFGVNDHVTREQLAVFMYRWVQLQGLDVSVRVDIEGYMGYEDVSAYAKEAMEWAVGIGLISGVESTVGGVTSYNLAPKGSATRAQVATILTRFCQYYQI